MPLGLRVAAAEPVLRDEASRKECRVDTVVLSSPLARMIGARNEKRNLRAMLCSNLRTMLREEFPGELAEPASRPSSPRELDLAALRPETLSRLKQIPHAAFALEEASSHEREIAQIEESLERERPGIVARLRELERQRVGDDEARNFVMAKGRMVATYYETTSLRPILESLLEHSADYRVESALEPCRRVVPYRRYPYGPMHW